MSGETHLEGPDLAQGIPAADLPDGGQARRARRRRAGAGGAAGRGGLRHRRDLHPLRRAARRGARRRRHGALPVAPRLLQPAHRRGRARAGAEPGRLLQGRARRGTGSSSARRSSRRRRRRPRRPGPGERPGPGGHRRRRRGGRGRWPRSCGARATAGASSCSPPRPSSPTTGPTSPRTTSPATRPRSGSRSIRREFYDERRIELRQGARATRRSIRPARP